MSKEEIEAAVLRDFQAVDGKTILFKGVVTAYPKDGGDQVDIALDRPVKFRVVPTPIEDVIHWNDDWCDPYWNIELAEDDPQLSECENYFWIFGHSYQLGTGETSPAEFQVIEEAA